jgi:hypothetical protein
MTTLKQYKYTRLQSPVGEAIYPHLNKPDTKYNADGHYKVKMKIPVSQELTDFVAAIHAENDKYYDQAVAAAKEAKKRPPKKAEVNYYEDDGYGYFNFKCNATIKTKDPVTGEPTPTAKNLPILSADGQKFDTVRYVNSGAELQAVIDLVPMDTAVAGAGVALRLICVKVHKFAALPPREAAPMSSVDAENAF